MTESAIAENLKVARKTPPVSRTLRLLTGGWLLYMAALSMHRPGWTMALAVSSTFVAVFLYYAVLHRLIGQLGFKWAMVAKIVTLVPVVSFVALNATDITPGVQSGILAFFGVSLVAQALRGDRGCEVMTLPTLLFRRQAYFPCLLFSPLDWFEESIYQAIRGH